VRRAAVLLFACVATVPVVAQGPRQGGPPQTRPAAGPPANPRDLAGKWIRTTPFQTFSNVKGGANEFQNDITQGKTPDLNRDTGLKYAEPAFTPAGKAAFDRNIPSYGLRITAPKDGNDPQGNCDPWGVPRMLNGQVAGPHAGWSVLQTADKFIQFSGWHHHYREVWTDGRALPSVDEAEPRWNGYSVGRWEANTFVVESLGFDPRTWLDHNGYPHTDQMRLQERYRLVDADTLELRMTITDPEYYAKPFESDAKLFRRDRENEKAWDEQIYCVPSEESRFNRLIRDGGVGKP
jgi:hypothetical protein